MFNWLKGDPIRSVRDRDLQVNETTIQALRELRLSNRFYDLPGESTDQITCLTELSNGLIESLIKGLAENPRKLWVMEQFQNVLEQMKNQDTEGREHFGTHLEEIMDILDIQSSDGLLTHYLF